MRSENRDRYGINIRVDETLYRLIDNEARDRFFSKGGLLKHAFLEWLDYERAKAKLGKKKLAAIVLAKEAAR